MPAPPDRDKEQQEQQNPTHPLPPKNVEILWAFYAPNNGVDIRWDDPSQLGGHTEWDIVGVNIYRSLDSEYGPYEKLNDEPVGSTFWRDETENELVEKEDVSDQFESRGNEEQGRYIFKTSNFPIVKSDSEATHANHPADVTVWIDGEEVVPKAVDGETGEVELSTAPIYNKKTNQKEDPPLPDPDSTVLCSYRYNTNLIRRRHYQRIFYRITTVGRREWDDKYRETPLEEADGETIHHMEDMGYIWREGVRRNGWILDQAGERVKVFVRKYMGERCDCWDSDYDSATQDCHQCFAPGSLVKTYEGGYKPIENIEIGEKVLTSDGTFHQVTDTFERDYEGSILSIDSRVSTEPLRVTPNHPIMTVRGSHDRSFPCGPKCDDYIKRGDGVDSRRKNVQKLPSGNWWARCQVNGSRESNNRKALGTYETKEKAKEVIEEYRKNNIEPGHELRWEEASALEEEDWTVAKWPEKIEDIDGISVPEKFRGSKNGPERLGTYEFEVNEEFLWMVGVYLAEGSSGTRSISFALHDKEVRIQNRLLDYFSGQGYNPKLKDLDGKKCTCVYVGSTTLSEWFSDWLGKNCYNKKIPSELMLLPPEKQKHIFNGVYDGDGWKNGNEITQTSEKMALQLSEILHRNGKQPLIRIQQSQELTPNGNKRAPAYCVSWEKEDFRHDNRKGRWKFKEEGEVLSRINSIQSEEYEGKVYNLEVEGDHTYVVNGVLVHNCFGTGIKGGYEGPYDITIAPMNAEKNIEWTDRGLNVSQEYDTWTGPSPLLSQRDFIVKQNNDRLGISGVKVPTNRGNVLQQHFNVEMMDEEDIRYEVPVTGTQGLTYPETREFQPGDDPTETRNPQVTEKEDMPDELEERGRTPTYENIQY